DLPAPFAPISATSSPLATSNETSFSTWVAPRNTFSSLTWRMGASGMGGPLSSRAQIGFDYGRISLHFGGRSLADELSTIEYLDAAAQAHDKAHVRFTHQNANAHVPVEAADEFDECLRFAGVQPRGGLVKKQGLRLR